MPNPVTPAFGHHHIPLLSLPGAAGPLGGKAHLAAVKDACKSAERIHGALTMAGRFELAVISDTPDFFDPSPGMEKARKLVWETIRTTLRLQWVIPTQHPDLISSSLPPTWIGHGFQNVCIGLVADGGDGISEKLEALRESPVKHRAIFLDPSCATIDLVGRIHGINWVVFSGRQHDAPLAATIETSCREANVPFLFHRTDGDMESCPEDDKSGEEPPWPVHPFGTKIQFFQPTLPDLKPVSTTLEEFFPPAYAEIKPAASSPAAVSITEHPIDSTPKNSTANAEPPTEQFEFEVITPEPEKAEPDVTVSGPPVISDNDHEDFTRLDGIVRRGLDTFIEVGQALAEIRNRELWRTSGHPNWAAYCLAQGLTKIHANRLIKGSEVAGNIAEVKPTGFTCPDVTPRSEWQIRPLHRLPDAEQQGIAWYRAAERANGQPTEKLISDVVAELMADDLPAPHPVLNRKARAAEVLLRLRAALNTRNSHKQLESLITELEQCLNIKVEL